MITMMFSSQARTCWQSRSRTAHSTTNATSFLATTTKRREMLAQESSNRPLDYKCIIIYRYYDEASKEFGTGETPPIQHFGKGLDELILRLRNKVCENPANGVESDDFRCYLVAHSMGGL